MLARRWDSNTSLRISSREERRTSGQGTKQLRLIAMTDGMGDIEMMTSETIMIGSR